MLLTLNAIAQFATNSLRPVVLSFRPVGLRFRPVGLRFRPVSLRFRPVGVLFRPQGLRFWVFVFDTSLKNVISDDRGTNLSEIIL